MADIRGTMEELLRVEARVDVLGEHRKTLRDDLEAEAVRTFEETGTIPSWKAPGLGTATLAEKKPVAVVTDIEAAVAWLDEHHPDQVLRRSTVTIGGNALAHPRVVEALALLRTVTQAELAETGGSITIRHDVEVAEAFTKALPKLYQTLADPTDDAAPERLFMPDGMLVVGFEVPRPKRYLTVRLNAEVRARARAEIRWADELARGLVEPCVRCEARLTVGDETCPDCGGRGILPIGTGGRAYLEACDAEAERSPVPVPDDELVDADAEPDYDDHSTPEPEEATHG